MNFDPGENVSFNPRGNLPVEPATSEPVDPNVSEPLAASSLPQHSSESRGSPAPAPTPHRPENNGPFTVDSVTNIGIESCEEFEGLQRLNGTSQVYVLDAGAELVLINTGDRLSAEKLAEALKDVEKPISTILVTHSFDEVAEGIPFLHEFLQNQVQKRYGSPTVIASAKTKKLLEAPHEALIHFNDVPAENTYKEDKSPRPHYQTDTTPYRLSPKPATIHQVVTEGGTLKSIGNLQIEVVHTPGVTDGALSFLIQREGDEKVIAFTGDLVTPVVTPDGSSGHAHRVGDLQKEYANTTVGPEQSIASIDSLLERRIDVLAPSFGDISTKPNAVLTSYKTNLTKYQKAVTALSEQERNREGKPLYKNEEEIHHVRDTIGPTELRCLQAEANTFVIKLKDKTSLVLDWTIRHSNKDQEASIFGKVGPVKACILTHAHDDHVERLPELREKNPDMKIYVSEVVENVLKNPELTHHLCRTVRGIQDLTVVETPEQINANTGDGMTEIDENVRFALVPITGHSRYMNLILLEVKTEKGNVRMVHVGDSFCFNANPGSGDPLFPEDLNKAESGELFVNFPVYINGSDHNSYGHIAAALKAFAPNDETTQYLLLAGHGRPVTDLKTTLPEVPKEEVKTLLDALCDHLYNVDEVTRNLSASDTVVTFGLDSLECEFQPSEITLPRSDSDRKDNRKTIKVQIPRPAGRDGKEFEAWGWISSVTEGCGAPPQHFKWSPADTGPLVLTFEVELPEEFPQDQDIVVLKFNVSVDGTPRRLGDMLRINIEDK